MIDAREIIDLRLSADHQRIHLRFRDAAGQTVELSLPACWLNAMLEALPRTADAEAIHPLDSWSMDRLGNDQDLVLTLRTPEGQAVSFREALARRGHGDDRDPQQSGVRRAQDAALTSTAIP